MDADVHVRARRIRMPDDIRDRLLDHTIGRDVDRARQLRGARRDIGRDLDPGRPPGSRPPGSAESERTPLVSSRSELVRRIRTIERSSRSDRVLAVRMRSKASPTA